MNKKNPFQKRGVTLVEMMVVIAILGASLFVARVLVNLLQGLFQSSASTEVLRDAQLTLYSITKDVRNSANIISASSGTLKLAVFNTQLGYRNNSLFDPITQGTMTYQYVKDSEGSHLRKTIEYPLLGVIEDKKILKNSLLEPDTTNYIFNTCEAFALLSGQRCPPSGASFPYKAVDIRLTMSPLYVQQSSITYSAQAMRRTRWWQN